MTEQIAARVFAADIDQFPPAMEFITGTFAGLGCSDRSLMQIEVAAEEIFVNVAHYAYPAGTEGTVQVRCLTEEGPMAVVEFSDSGVAFDPLAKPDADITLSAEERRIGGLGILMVKRTMDEVTYRREDGKNILTIKRRFSE